MTKSRSSKTYCIGDIHGRFDILKKVLEVIKEHSKGEECKLVVTGDFVDRGPQSRQIIEKLREGFEENIEFVVIQGNHEDIFLQAVDNPSLLSWWVSNGGGSTLYSYGLSGEDLWALMHGEPTKTNFERDYRWLSDLPVYYEDAHRMYVHAGLDPNKELKDQNKEFMQWVLSDRHSSYSYKGKHIVHGHMQYEDGPILLQHRSNFDTFAWRTGRQAIGVFEDDKEGGPVEILWAQCT